MWTLSIHPPQASGLSPCDVVVRAQPTATVCDLAAALAAHLGLDRSSDPFLVPATAGVPWPAGQPLTECGLRSGDLLAVVPLPPSWAHQPGGPLRRRAVLTVVSGVDTGHTVALCGDAATLGRGVGCTVRLGDAMMSRRHARILLAGSQPVVVDEGSAGGTFIDGAPVTGPTHAPWGSRITIGTSTVVLSPASDGPARDGESGAVLRPARFGEPLAAEVIQVGAAPTRQPRPHLPWAMLLLPIIMGASLFVSGYNAGALAVVLGWPAVLLLDHALQVRHAAKQFAAELALWREDLAVVLDRLDARATAQRRRADLDHPPVDGLRSRVLGRRPALWQRQPAAADFLACRVGSGPVAALVTAVIGEGGDRAATADGRDELDRRRLLTEAPVVHHLGPAPVTAIVGPAGAVDATVRACVLRLCADHSPVEVAVVAILSAQRAYQETWLRWLPHTHRRTAMRPSVAIGAGPGHALLEALVADQAWPQVTVCLIDEQAGLSRRRVEAVAGLAAPRRLHLLWLGGSVDTVPPSTDTVLDLTASVPADSAVAETAIGGQPTIQPVAVLAGRERSSAALLSDVDTLDLVGAWTLARGMHGCTDEVTVRPADTDLPERVRLAELSDDFADLDDLDVVRERWAASRGLRAQLGLGADGVVTVDLREDGPHALLAGTTGAGKSELMQTLLCSLALNNPPERMTFLLVDYKGGAAFRECARLPHTVGYVTDLNPAEVHRALVSLGAEITAREELLGRYGVKDLAQLETEHPHAAPPSLLICVDEFAALTAEVPEFVDGMVGIAQRGRSLGLHLFLATQRPAGVVTANIQANTDLRIALRVASPDDSRDVLDRPDAADITRLTPGRALIRRVGHGSTDLVQVAWMGAREPIVQTARPVTVRPFTATIPTDPGAIGHLHHRTDLDRLVATIDTAFTATAAPLPRKPWLPPLPSELRLDDLPVHDVGDAVAVGMVDEPRHQRQRPLLLDYPRIGHVLVYGASRAGKTELLRTVTMSSTLTGTGVPAHVYGLDFGGGGLARLADWPTVGAVIGESDLPRVLRMLRWLDRTVRDRNHLLAGHDAPELHGIPHQERPPRIHVLVDNLPALLTALENNRIHLQHADLLTTVLQEGRRVGIHITATTPSRTALPVAMHAAFGQRLVLRMTNTDDYDLLGVPARTLHPDSPPGRGLSDQNEIQLASAGTAARTAEPQVRDRLRTNPPTSILAMPTNLPHHHLPAPVDDHIPLAVDADQITPVVVPLRGTVLIIAGRARSGRSTALAGIAAQAHRSTQPPTHTVHLDPEQPTLDGLDQLWSPPPHAWSLLLIDDAHRWETEHPDTTGHLAKLAREAANLNLAVVITTDTDHARTDPGDLVATALRGRTGILLQPETVDDGLLGADLPYTTIEPTSGTGRGLWCRDGTTRVVQVIS